MRDDIEETLSRELWEVAGRLQVPPMPTLPVTQPSAPARRHWLPMLVAAGVVLIVAGAVAVGSLIGPGNPDLEPAPPAASRTQAPTPTEAPTPLARTAPRIPYVLDKQLYVDGVQVPGAWWSVQSGDAGWIALNDDSTWWWGTGPTAHKLSMSRDISPMISPNGRYIVMVEVQEGRTVVTGFDVRRGGDGLGAVPVDPGKTGEGDPVRVRAVTDDGVVVVQGMATSLMWLPLKDGATVDLDATAPGQVILRGTPNGVVAVGGANGSDGATGAPYLAELSDAGQLSRIRSLPRYDDLVVGPGRWLLWVPPGSMGGEVVALGTLEVQTIDGADRATMTAPRGWGFKVLAWAWEDAEHVIAPVLADSDQTNERIARCDVRSAQCVLVKAP